MGGVVPPPGRKGVLSTWSPIDPRLPTTVDWVIRHRQNPCIHSQLDRRHPPENLPRHPASSTPYTRSSTTQAPSAPLSQHRHPVAGTHSPHAHSQTYCQWRNSTLAESHNPPGNKKKHWTPYRRVSSHLLQARFFQSLKTSSGLCPPSCFVCKSLSSEISTARCRRH